MSGDDAGPVLDARHERARRLTARGAEDRGRRAKPVQLLEDAELQRQILGHGLDDEASGARVGERCRCLDARQHRAGVLGEQLVLLELDEAGAADLIQVKTPDLGSVTHTVDAVLTCQANGIGVVLGGSCAETDVSARATTHIALATGATQLLAKPGMGVDEPLMVVGNEMRRCVRLDELRRAGGWGG